MVLMMMLALVGGAGAEGRAVAAEHSRLTEEMRSQASRNRWDAVDDHYRSLSALRGAKLTYEDHWMGAQAASSLGDIQATWARLRKALDAEFTDEALAWWATLTAQYGEVSLTVKTEDRAAVTLTIAEPPLELEKRATIEAAQAALRSEGAFEGLLPLGQYRLGELEFEVIGGPAVREVLR